MNSLIVYTLNIIAVLMCILIVCVGESIREIVVWTLIGGVNLLSAINIGTEIMKTIK